MQKIDSALRNRTIVVEKSVILETLRKNWDKHVEEYNEAKASFKKEMYDKLDLIQQEALTKVDRKINSLRDIVEDETIDKFVELAGNAGVRQYQDNKFILFDAHYIELPIPVSFEDCYKKAFDFINIDNRDEIEMDYDFYRCVMLDEWDWTTEFASKTLCYSSPKR